MTERKLVFLPGRQDVEVTCSMCDVEFQAVFFYDPDKPGRTKRDVRAECEVYWQGAHDEQGDCKFPITVNEIAEDHDLL